MKLSQLKVNAEAASQGRWVGELQGLGDIEFFVRGTNNVGYRRRMQALIRALPPKKRKKGIVDPAEMDRIIGLCLLDHALLNWKNVTDDDDKEIPYSREQAEVYLTDPDYGAFRDGVLVAASSVDDDEEEEDEVTEKNSEKPSVTT